jgi:adenylate kinase family enzyme
VTATLGRLKRVAVFGNAGAGKSTLARNLAAITALPLEVVDKLQYRPGGERVPREEYLRAHAALIASDKWIIDGFGCSQSIWERLDAADTLIHIDLPLAVHALWVTKRLFKGLFATPEGWPDDSPLIRSSIQSYRVLWPCHSCLTPKYRSYVSKASGRKRVFHLRSKGDIQQFLEMMRIEYARSPRSA